MKLASFNINNIRKRLANLLAWIDDARPDVLCLQELKTADPDFPAAELAEAGYSAVWCGQSAWNGVAILSRGRPPVRVLDHLPGDPGDREARYLEAAVQGILVACVYAPNGNPQPGPKFDAKLAWTERLIARAEALIDADVPAVLAGDFNIAPSVADVYPSQSYDENALVQPQPRAQFARLLAQGWTDAVRALQPDGEAFTFWDYRRRRFDRNAGLRLDHLLLSPRLAGGLAGYGIDRDARAREGASDHAPVWIDLKGPERGSHAAGVSVGSKRTSQRPT